MKRKKTGLTGGKPLEPRQPFVAVCPRTEAGWNGMWEAATGVSKLSVNLRAGRQSS